MLKSPKQSKIKIKKAHNMAGGGGITITRTHYRQFPIRPAEVNDH